MTSNDEIVRVFMENLREKLQTLKDGGIEFIPKSSKNDDSAARLKKLRESIDGCQKCKLCQGRKNIVFGSGNPQASLLFIGEGPGKNEDEQGLPFVGRAGQLLTKMIEAMGLSRDEVYICNIVKCRPPENRDPESDEIDACEPILKKQLEIINPKVIVGLGKYACQTLLSCQTQMSKMRGNWQEYKQIKFMPTFHPAYLLRNPSAKKVVWEDLKKVMAILELPINS